MWTKGAVVAFAILSVTIVVVAVAVALWSMDQSKTVSVSGNAEMTVQVRYDPFLPQDRSFVIVSKTHLVVTCKKMDDVDVLKAKLAAVALTDMPWAARPTDDGGCKP